MKKKIVDVSCLLWYTSAVEALGEPQRRLRGKEPTPGTCVGHPTVGKRIDLRPEQADGAFPREQSRVFILR